MGKTQWVSPRGDGKWAVKSAGASKASKLFDTQADAVAHAVETAKRTKSEVIIQGKDGKIRSKDSYGNDPCPPKDREH